MLELLLGQDLVDDLIEEVLWVVDCAGIVRCRPKCIVAEYLLVNEAIE